MLVVKKPPANAGDLRDMGSILAQEDPLEEEMNMGKLFHCARYYLHVYQKCLPFF